MRASSPLLRAAASVRSTPGFCFLLLIEWVFSRVILIIVDDVSLEVISIPTSVLSPTSPGSITTSFPTSVVPLRIILSATSVASERFCVSTIFVIILTPSPASPATTLFLTCRLLLSHFLFRGFFHAKVVNWFVFLIRTLSFNEHLHIIDYFVVRILNLLLHFYRLHYWFRLLRYQDFDSRLFDVVVVLHLLRQLNYPAVCFSIALFLVQLHLCQSSLVVQTCFLRKLRYFPREQDVSVFFHNIHLDVFGICLHCVDLHWLNN